VLRRHSLDAKVVVITNATLLDRPAVAEALVALAARPSEVWAKLDAGTEDYYQQVERTKVPLAKVLANLLSLGRRRPLVIQALFMCLHGQPPPAAELDAWLARLAELHAAGCRIERVQVYTTARDTAESFVTPLDRPALDALGERVRSLGLAAEVFYGPG
jgi:wyosine [tRNA(Phe)-imidazoG37] synthetase (radical SAM superfamily)